MKRLMLFVQVVLFITACNPRENNPVRITGESIGTFYHITYYGDHNRNFNTGINNVLDEVMKSCNIFDSNSTLSRMNSNKTSRLDVITKEVLLKSLVISEKTDGIFDVTAGALVNLWGFGSKNRDEKAIEKREVDSILHFTGYKKIKIEGDFLIKEDPRITLDFGAIAKGYAVDLTARYLEAEGIKNYLVEIGGEIYTKGIKPDGKEWVIGISVPDENNPYSQEYQEKIKLKDKGLATSGNYRNFYETAGEKRVHTINPVTGYPAVNELLSVTIIADNCTDADAMATAVMASGLQKGKEIISEETDKDAYFIYLDENGMIRTFATDGFKKLIVK